MNSKKNGASERCLNELEGGLFSFCFFSKSEPPASCFLPESVNIHIPMLAARVEFFFFIFISFMQHLLRVLLRSIVLAPDSQFRLRLEDAEIPLSSTTRVNVTSNLFLTAKILAIERTLFAS